MMLPSLLGKQFSLRFSCVRLVWFVRASVGLQIDDCFSVTKGFRSARCREFSSYNDSRAATLPPACARTELVSWDRGNSRHAPKPRKFSRLGYDLAHHFDVRIRKRQGGNDRNQVLVKYSHSDISEELWVGSDHGGVEHEDHLAGAGRNCEREINAIPRRHC